MSYPRIVSVVIENSSRAAHYFDKVRPFLRCFAAKNHLKFIEIRLGCLRPLSSGELLRQKLSDRETIARQIEDNDLVVSCGGDGVTQLTLDAVYFANLSLKIGASLAIIPLGNGNDFASAVNGRSASIDQILRQNSRNFYPLLVDFEGDEDLRFAIASYITFGATTKLVEVLNQSDVRARRKVLARLTPAASLPLAKISVLSQAISSDGFPDFWRSGVEYDHDSLGFFNVSAAHGLLRVARHYLFDQTDFFFHLGTVADKNLARKILMAGRWMIKFPGQATSAETITFARKINLVANLAGDNIKLVGIREIHSQKAQKPVKVLSAQKL